MKYLVLVSHGGLAAGLKTSLGMFAGDAIERVEALGIKPGEAVGDFKARIQTWFDVKGFRPDDQFVVMADIVGGSPLTTFTSILQERGYLGTALIFGGTNLTMALTALVSMDAMDNETLSQSILSEGNSALQRFQLTTQADDDDDI